MRRLSRSSRTSCDVEKHRASRGSRDSIDSRECKATRSTAGSSRVLRCVAVFALVGLLATASLVGWAPQLLPWSLLTGPVHDQQSPVAAQAMPSRILTNTNLPEEQARLVLCEFAALIIYKL